MTTTQTTKVNRGWFIKRIVLPVIALLVLGTWGLVDATVIYPRNGRLDASLKLKNYMQSASDAGRLTPSFIKVDSPSDELAKLAAREDVTGGQALSAIERARMDWLRSLKTVWALNAEEIWVGDLKRPMRTATGEPVYAGVGGVSDVKHEALPLFYVPRSAEGVVVAAGGKREPLPLSEVFKTLQANWQTAETPAALALYDLPFQWLFTVVGFGGALYLVALYMRVAARKFRYEPETSTLILPGGERVAAADVAEFDKRRWHKFYVTLNRREGKPVTLDLYRYDPLEEWVLEMERVAFPEAAADEGTKSDGDEDADLPPPPKDLGKVSSMNYGGLMDGSFAVFVFDGAEVARAGMSAPANCQGEVLKALGVALRDEGGWRQWLTAGAGPIASSSHGVLIEMLTEQRATFKSDVTRLRDSADVFISRVKAGAHDLYAVVAGRLAPEVAAKAHDSLMDPPATGYLGMALLRLTPSAIDGVVGPLGWEPGMEIKGVALIGNWAASGDDVEQAGLSASGADHAAA